MPYRFDIIGEHRTDPFRFLVRDEEGQPYSWDLELTQLRPIEAVRPEEWRLDADQDRIAARAPDER